MTRRGSLAMILAGVVLVAFGVIGGFAFADDEPAGTTPESPAELYATLQSALRAGDVDTLLARLDPAVLDTYGEGPCRAYLAGIDQRDVTLKVTDVGPPETWLFGERDNLAIPIADAIPITVVQTAGGTPSEPVKGHVHLVGEELRWFTDCGDPR